MLNLKLIRRWTGPLKIALAALATLTLAACASVPSNAPPPTAQDTPGEYLLGTGDQLRLTVFNEPTLSGEFEVDAAGMISIPLIGNMKASGQTARVLEAEITKKLSSGYMRDPRVNIEILKYRPFYIIGEVSKPGEYPYRSGMNVMSAVAVAGGFTYRASENSVRIRRAGQTDEHTYPLTTTTMVYPGDIVRVPERLF